MIFKIRCYKDLDKMLRKINKLTVNEELKYVAMELADNMVKAKTYGLIKIDCERNQVVNDIEGNIFTWKELSMFLSTARFVFRNKDIWFPFIQKNNSRGFISILFMDWDLYTLKFEDNNYSIIARKKC